MAVLLQFLPKILEQPKEENHWLYLLLPPYPLKNNIVLCQKNRDENNSYAGMLRQ